MEAKEFQKKYSDIPPRPKEAFELFLAGKSDAEIAQAMSVSEPTVRQHISTVAEKFGLRNGERTSHRSTLKTLGATNKPELLVGRNSGAGWTVLLGYWDNSSPETKLVQQLQESLKAEGYQVFAAGAQLMGTDDGPAYTEANIRMSDGLVLLLSEEAGVSETIADVVKQAKSHRDASANQKPVIVPILVNCPLTALNNELQDYLNGIRPYQWRSDADTATLMREVIAQFTGQPVAANPTPGLPLNREHPYPRPLPVAAPELPVGQVRLDSTYYIEPSPMEADCYREILQPGALIRIKAPRQMGKTSLMARILHQAKAAGCETMTVNCQRASSQVLNDLDTFLRWFCEQVGRRLGKLPDLESHWTGSVSTDKCHYYFEECLLPEIDSSLVIGLDEADVIFPYQQVASDFFGLLRSWFEMARSTDSSSQLWEKLRLVIVHSTEVYTIMDVNQSPFNVGMPVELQEFTKKQVEDLAQRHGLSISDDHQAKLMAMVGGHPFLLRLAFYNMQSQNLTLEELLQAAPTDQGIFKEHLQEHLCNLYKNQHLLTAFSDLVSTTSPFPLKTDLSFKLHRMGLVHLDGNTVRLRCDLYRQYFREILPK